MIRYVTAVLLLAAAPVSHGETFTFSKTVIDPNPYAAGTGLNYDKLLDHFTSPDHLSYFLGAGTGAYLYDGPGRKITISATGSHYERARAFMSPGDAFPGVVASVDNTLVWYRNPANSKGANAGASKGANGASWTKYVINPGSGCHDLRVVDLDGDGKQDVLCSATSAGNRPENFVAFQNSADDWQIVNNFNPAGDGIDVVSIKGVNDGARTNIVACNPHDSNLYWFKNPGGSAARDPANWIASRIGGCTAGVSVGSLDVGGRDIVVVASNETQPAIWPNGLAYYDPESTPDTPWKRHIIDRTYRDVHEIAGGAISGVPFITVGEEEQASSVCNAFAPRQNDHPAVKGCRVAIFPWTGSGFGAPTLLSTLGTQNQEVMVMGNTGYVVGANHAGFKATDPAFNVWKFKLRAGRHPVTR
jgi:hypothetical protein